MSKPRGPKPTPPRPVPSAWQAVLAGGAADPLKRAEWLASLDHQLRIALPLQLAAHARLANVDGNRLVYSVDGPAWSSRLRLSGDAILEAARSLGLAVDALAIRVVRMPAQPGVGVTQATPRRSASGSERTALRAMRELIAQGPAGDQSDENAPKPTRADRLRARRPSRPEGAS
ncbi:MAG: DUF721 domain-containing protein [Proteobacteria bacterium]|nr:DUF721 domain-containing protein [Pseudomonadota bacterium]